MFNDISHNSSVTLQQVVIVIMVIENDVIEHTSLQRITQPVLNKIIATTKSQRDTSESLWGITYIAINVLKYLLIFNQIY